MATGGNSEGNWGDDFRNTCSLCMESYRGRQPKLLPCFHTFCLPCLTTLAATAASTTPVTANNQDGSEGEKNADSATENEKAAEEEQESKCSAENKLEESGYSGGNGEVASPAVFLCPTCRSPVKVPEGGVENLQTNFYLDVEEADTPRCPVSCDMCEEGEKQEATHCCDKCQQHMCRTCRRLHDKFTDARTHIVRPVTAKEQPKRSDKPRTCQIHPDQSLCLHCVKCDVSICMLCKLTSHEGHPTEDMRTANIKAREELKGLLAKANEQIQVAESKLCLLDRNERELIRQKQEVTREVCTRFEKAMAIVAQARDDVIEELESREKAAVSEIQAEKMAARSTAETFSGLLKRAGTESDFVSLKNEMQAALLTDDVLDDCRKAATNNENKFFAYQTDTSDLEVEIVKAYMGKLVNPDEVQASGNQAMVSFRELATSFANLQASVTKVTSETADLSTKFGDLQNTVTKAESTTSEVEKAVTKLQDETSGNGTQLAKLTQQISADVSNLTIMIQKSAQLVSFYAVLQSNCKKSDGPKIVFQEVKYNEGGCYDSATGTFTTPCEGVYIFTVTVRAADQGQIAKVSVRVKPASSSPAGQKTYWEAVLGLIDSDRVVAWARGSFTCYGSSSACVSLKANTQVWVSMNDGHCGGTETSFSGALVQAKV